MPGEVRVRNSRTDGDWSRKRRVRGVRPKKSWQGAEQDCRMRSAVRRPFHASLSAFASIAIRFSCSLGRTSDHRFALGVLATILPTLPEWEVPLSARPEATQAKCMRRRREADRRHYDAPLLGSLLFGPFDLGSATLRG
ncbi:hypothetical protein GQ53DRAFT_749177 [Thozetella sp. PMI_491]|nr:hypothetical protein GQ53DRAFT_749177 [Thozetella sp. PMI_491]